MGLFGKKNISIDIDKLRDKNSYIDFNEPLIPKPEEPKEEWIWVEGYKGVDMNMQGYGGFQYELGVEYSIDGEVKECYNGFHFSKNLGDVFNYRDCLYNRFFKVKGLVKTSDVALYGKRIPYNDDYYCFNAPIKDKLVAKKIILTEEIIDCEEILMHIKNKYPEVQTLDDARQARLLGYDKFVHDKYAEKLSKYFSELFVELFIETFRRNSLSNKTKEIIAYMEEGVSKDVAIYLLMK